MPPMKESDQATSLCRTTLEHHSKILQNLNKLRQNTTFCDVEVSAGDGISIKAHRVVLSASTPYFEAMFSRGLIEERQSNIILHSINGYILRILIDFIYTGDVRITRDNVQDVMAAADMIQLKDVVTTCTQFMKSELHPSNAVGIYRFAEVHNFRELITASTKYIQDHFTLVCCEEEFLELPKEQLCYFLSSEYLKVDSEFQVFEASMRWFSHDVIQRRRYVFEILKPIRLPLLPTTLLEKAISECIDVSLKVALKSVRNDLIMKKGSLVPLSVSPRIAAKKDIYVIGGSKREIISTWTRSECTYTSIECFDTFKQQWCPRKSSMAIGRIQPGVVALDGLIYVVGGEQDSQILANGEVYNPRDDTWASVASMVVPRCEFGLCALHGYLYAIGGWVGEDIGGSIERYDPLENVWALDGSLPAPRFSMGVVAYQGLIYIVGGCLHNKRHLTDLISYNPVTSEWVTLAPMLVPRSQMGVAVLNHFLYVVGGINRQHEVLQSVERYNFLEDKWTEVPALKRGRASPAVAAADGLLYVMGGDHSHEVNFYRARITMTSVECFNPLTNAWTDRPPLPESRSEAGSVVV
ncbi:actin-binding protein IPP [Cloeon dipterum]|uniref:Kelch-like protein diablo n=1 Tax=Cloeon dipterum TaxID=197152 RepID=A0A8S1DDG4_9INSE|nr:Hypothetical predicted protein [Cloeon dipterum]